MRVFLLAIICASVLYPQVKTPLEKNKFLRTTSNQELVEFVKEVSGKSRFIKMDSLCFSSEGKLIPLLKISSTHFGESPDKIKVMIFAQQHGNEHSGKEGSLLFLNEVASGRIDYLFDKIDLILIPQLNPDGNDKNQRRNGRGVDLNRNHLILTEPETIALHDLFNRYLPEATLDIHEYTPFGKEWIDFGYRKNFDEQIGILTNPNIFHQLMDFQRNKFLPYMEKFLYSAGFSFNEYMVGGPPGKSRLRYSTVDINDGRQSFGIQNTFSAIVEGINGKEPAENIGRRAEGQYKAILGFLHFIYDNSEVLKKTVDEGRKNLIDNSVCNISLQMEHVKSGNKKISLLSIKTGRDTIIEATDFHEKIESRLSAGKPAGYLLPEKETEVISLLARHNIRMTKAGEMPGHLIIQMSIKAINKTELEELEILIPEIEKTEKTGICFGDYLFIPLNQLKSNAIMLILEPESMMNILQYENHSSWLKKDSVYPVLRVEKIQ